MPRGRKKRYYRLNHYIQAPTVRVIDKQGKQLGIMPLAKALAEAKKTDLDLVEVAPEANPPVCKILKFRNFLYEKRLGLQKRGKSKKSGGELKEIRLKPFVSDHDLCTKLERIKEFLAGKDNVRITILFRGREAQYKEFGTQLIEKVINQLGEKAKVLVPPKFKGRLLVTTLGPKK